MRRRFCYNHFIKQRKNAESGADMEQNAIKTVAFGGFDKEDVARCIEKLSQETDAVRSERDALQEQADYITEMVMRRHPYERGIGAREGIEY